MKTAEPKKIYLQIGDDADIAEFKPEDFETNTITWCWEKIFKNDIEYISKQSIIGLIDKRLAEVANWKKLDSDAVALFDRGYKQALTELKQKIEAL